MFKCVCGKEFENKSCLAGHRSHCLEYYISIDNVEQFYKNLEDEKSRLAMMQKRRHELSVQNQNEKLLQWVSEQHTCERCGKIMTEKYASGRFCSKECAHSRTLSEESRKKISNAVRGLPPVNKGKSVKYDRVLSEEEWISYHTCHICGAVSKHYLKHKLCQNCLYHSDEGKQIRKQLGKETYEKVASEGRFVGWTSRNITSYAECFWKKVLDNNSILYQREPTIYCNNGTHYFADFLVDENLDIEIDGKQHTYEDRAESDKIRDKNLAESGYIVYRIPWLNPKDDETKAQVKHQVDDLLEFILNLQEDR